MMEGQPIIACQDNGKWSRAVGIKCKEISKYLETKKLFGVFYLVIW